MATQFELHETQSGLVVKVKMRHAQVHALFSGSVAASALAILAYHYARASIVIVVALVGGIFGIPNPITFSAFVTLEDRDGNAISRSMAGSLSDRDTAHRHGLRRRKSAEL